MIPKFRYIISQNLGTNLIWKDCHTLHQLIILSELHYVHQVFIIIIFSSSIFSPKSYIRD
jgi:hypothetical protein